MDGPLPVLITDWLGVFFGRKDFTLRAIQCFWATLSIPVFGLFLSCWIRPLSALFGTAIFTILSVNVRLSFHARPYGFYFFVLALFLLLLSHGISEPKEKKQWAIGMVAALCFLSHLTFIQIYGSIIFVIGLCHSLKHQLRSAPVLPAIFGFLGLIWLPLSQAKMEEVGRAITKTDQAFSTNFTNLVKYSHEFLFPFSADIFRFENLLSLMTVFLGIGGIWRLRKNPPLLGVIAMTILLTIISSWWVLSKGYVTFQPRHLLHLNLVLIVLLSFGLDSLSCVKPLYYFTPLLFLGLFWRYQPINYYRYIHPHQTPFNQISKNISEAPEEIYEFDGFLHPEIRTLYRKLPRRALLPAQLLKKRNRIFRAHNLLDHKTTLAKLLVPETRSNLKFVEFCHRHGFCQPIKVKPRLQKWMKQYESQNCRIRFCKLASSKKSKSTNSLPANQIDIE